MHIVSVFRNIDIDAIITHGFRIGMVHDIQEHILVEAVQNLGFLAQLVIILHFHFGLFWEIHRRRDVGTIRHVSLGQFLFSLATGEQKSNQ